MNYEGITPLYGHVSPETAYVIDDYPYGRSLRCKRRCWLEWNPKHGARFVAQTTNPKITSREVWNKPHKSTYEMVGAVMYLDATGHVQWAALRPYAGPDEVRQYMTTFPGVDVESINLLIRAKIKYASVTAAGEHTVTLNGKPCMPDDDAIGKATAELDEWRRIVRDMMSGAVPTTAPDDKP